jgi:hypothetical protein
MSLTTFKIGRKEFVVIPRKRYDELSQAEANRRDAEIARKGPKAFLSGKLKPIPLEETRRKWGV